MVTIRNKKAICALKDTNTNQNGSDFRLKGLPVTKILKTETLKIKKEETPLNLRSFKNIAECEKASEIFKKIKKATALEMGRLLGYTYYEAGGHGWNALEYLVSKGLAIKNKKKGKNIYTHV